MAIKITKENQVLAIAAAVILIGGYFYFNNLLMPSIEIVNQRNKQLAELKGKLDDAERQAQRLPALQNDLEKVQQDLTLLEKQLPKGSDIPGILRIVTKEASGQNINFVSLTPREPKKETYFDIIEFEMTVTGNFHSFARFLTSLGQQERIFKIEQLKISLLSQTPEASAAGPPMLNINFVLKTYAYNG